MIHILESMKINFNSKKYIVNQNSKISNVISKFEQNNITAINELNVTLVRITPWMINKK